MLTLLFDGIAYGMLLFVLAIGLAVTLGLMNFVNLAHGAFAMAGGYVTVLPMDRASVPFLWTLPLAFLVPAVIGGLAEATLYRPLYKRPHLDHVLLSIGLVFMTIAAVDYGIGSQQQIIKLPAWLQGRYDIGGVGIGKYRLFIVVVCLALTALLQWMLARTRFGSRLRAAVASPFGWSLRAIRDNRLRAAAIGLNVNLRLGVTYTISAAMAGAAGAALAQTTGFASLDGLDFHRSADVLLVVVIGGAGWLWGGVLGAIALKLLHDLLSAWTPQYWTFWLGLFLVVLVMVGRDRLFKPSTWWRKS
jgi:branched-chain amino acid transport system permease protein